MLPWAYQNHTIFMCIFIMLLCFIIAYWWCRSGVIPCLESQGRCKRSKLLPFYGFARILLVLNRKRLEVSCPTSYFTLHGISVEQNSHKIPSFDGASSILTCTSIHMGEKYSHLALIVSWIAVKFDWRQFNFHAIIKSSKNRNNTFINLLVVKYCQITGLTKSLKPSMGWLLKPL